MAHIGMPSFAPDMWDYDASVHPWRLVCWITLRVHYVRGDKFAAELCRETDTRRVLELSKELDEALEVQTSIHKSASAKPAPTES